MGHLFGFFSSCSDVNNIATVSLVKTLYWHFTGILLRLPERKDFGSFHAPVLKVSKKRLVSLVDAKKFGHFEEHRTAFGSLSDKVALNRRLLLL